MLRLNFIQTDTIELFWKTWLLSSFFADLNESPRPGWHDYDRSKCFSQKQNQFNPRKVVCLLFNLNSSHQKTKFLNIPTISALIMPWKFSSRRHFFSYLKNTSKRYCTSYIQAILCPQSISIRYFLTESILLRLWFLGGGLGLNGRIGIEHCFFYF